MIEDMLLINVDRKLFLVNWRVGGCLVGCGD